MEALVYLVIVLSFFMLARNVWAFRIQMKALAVVSIKAREAIDNGDRDWERFYRRYHERSYEGVLFDLTAWTPRQAYPWLYETSI
jgi:hypothetical protein